MKFTGHKRNNIWEEEPTEDAIIELGKEIMVLKNEIKITKKKDEEKDKLINIILEQNRELKKTVEELKETVEESKETIEELKETVEELKEKNYYLKREIDDLYPIAFSCKLRKLLKKLLQYMVNDPVLSSGLIRIEKDIYFLKWPTELNSLYFSKYDIIDAFNLLLDIIKSYSLDCDYRAHYINKNALFQNSLRKRINVFGNYKDFFRFFNFDEKYQDILIKLIPAYFFETIDNYTFEEKISSLMSKIK